MLKGDQIYRGLGQLSASMVSSIETDCAQDVHDMLPHVLFAAGRDERRDASPERLNTLREVALVCWPKYLVEIRER
mgnify:CR=1 FL=1